MAVIPAIAAASLVATAVGGGISAYGQQQAGQAAQRSGEYQAQVAMNNKKIADAAADRAVQEGLVESERNDMKVRGLFGSQKVAQAANGVDVNSGTALEIRKGTRELGMLDSETIIANSQNKAYGYRVQGMNYEAEAQFDRMKGENARRAGNIGAFGTLIGTAGSVGDKWIGYKTKGMYG